MLNLERRAIQPFPSRVKANPGGPSVKLSETYSDGLVELAGFDSEEAAAEEIESPVTEDLTTDTVAASDQQKATVAKRRSLLIALKHECISQEERNQMFMKIDSMTVECCELALAKVNVKIKEYDLDNH